MSQSEQSGLYALCTIHAMDVSPHYDMASLAHNEAREL